VPHVYASDSRRGFIVMEDLGNTPYLSVLKTGRGVDKLYGDALATLANIQVRGARAAQQLEPYSRAPLERELNLFPEWFLHRHLGLETTPEERALITVTFEFLINEAMLQPQVFVHRDFHSRNLMVLPASSAGTGGPGVIDFQDALRGPIGYDLASLFKDCYISWSRERVERWVKGYRRVLGNLGANVGDSEYQFMRWFDVIGVQRHIKVLGIFCRLWYRDGKPGYLADLPLTFEYVRDACTRYPELVEFGRWLEWRIAPLLGPAISREIARAAARAARAASKPKPQAKPKAKSKSKSKPKPKRKKSKAPAPVRRRATRKSPVRGRAKVKAKAKTKPKAKTRAKVARRGVKSRVVARRKRARSRRPSTPRKSRQVRRIAARKTRARRRPK
jgi:aminoglycoside/choline kinase family phosphotransferase